MPNLNLCMVASLDPGSVWTSIEAFSSSRFLTRREMIMPGRHYYALQVEPCMNISVLKVLRAFQGRREGASTFTQSGELTSWETT